MSTRQEREDQFEWWITCIPDKIDALKERLPNETSNNLDFSPASIDLLEKYLFENYSYELLKEDKDFWDACASYVVKTFELNIPGARLVIELDNVQDAYYNMPVVEVLGTPKFAPHFLVSASLGRKKGDFISTLLINEIKRISERKL